MGFFKDLLRGATKVLNIILPLLPLLDSKVKMKMTTEDATGLAEASAAGHELATALDDVFDLIDAAISPEGPEGDDITVSEASSVGARLVDVEKRAEVLVERIKAL